MNRKLSFGAKKIVKISSADSKIIGCQEIVKKLEMRGNT